MVFPGPSQGALCPDRLSGPLAGLGEEGFAGVAHGDGLGVLGKCVNAPSQALGW